MGYRNDIISNIHCRLRGPELFDLMVDRKVFPELEARLLVRKILKAVAYLHSENVAHRDIKVFPLLFVWN